MKFFYRSCLLNSKLYRTNQWIEAFEAYDIPWIMGASIYDRNALARMRSLFGGFEYVTSNMIGSHLVYAPMSPVRFQSGNGSLFIQ